MALAAEHSDDCAWSLQNDTTPAIHAAIRAGHLDARPPDRHVQQTVQQVRLVYTCQSWC
jgi:hypothetical protein